METILWRKNKIKMTKLNYRAWVYGWYFVYFKGLGWGNFAVRVVKKDLDKIRIYSHAREREWCGVVWCGVVWQWEWQWWWWRTWCQQCCLAGVHSGTEPEVWRCESWETELMTTVRHHHNPSSLGMVMLRSNTTLHCNTTQHCSNNYYSKYLFLNKTSKIFLRF